MMEVVNIRMYIHTMAGGSDVTLPRSCVSVSGQLQWLRDGNVGLWGNSKSFSGNSIKVIHVVSELWTQITIIFMCPLQSTCVRMAVRQASCFWLVYQDPEEIEYGQWKGDFYHPLLCVVPPISTLTSGLDPEDCYIYSFHFNLLRAVFSWCFMLSVECSSHFYKYATFTRWL